MSENINQKKDERLKLYRQQQAMHKPKNRSSKHLRFLKGYKPIWHCMSGEQLKTLNNNGCFEAGIEIDRRVKNYNKREMRMQRYREKLAAKRSTKA